MAPITITVVTEDRRPRSIRISDQNHLDSWLEKKLKVESLVKDGVEDDRFESLVDGGTYTLGPAVQPPITTAAAPRLDGKKRFEIWMFGYH